MINVAKFLVSRKAMVVGVIWTIGCTLLEVGSSIFMGTQINVVILALLYGVMIFWNKCIKDFEKQEAEDMAAEAIASQAQITALPAEVKVAG